MKWVRCPSCGIVGDRERSAKCPWCDHDLPDVAGAGVAEPPEVERRTGRDLKVVWYLLASLGILAVLACLGVLNGPGPLPSLLALLMVVFLPTGVLWLIYLGIHRAVTGSPSRHPVAMFLAFVPLTILGLVILVFIACSQMRF